MSYNPTNMYDLEPHIAEIYDQSETYRDDVDLLLSLMKSVNLGVLGRGGSKTRSYTAQNTQISDVYPKGSDASQLCLGDERGSYLRILEPFCGTGRILIPLAQAGHTLVGLDQAAGMLDRARQKLARLDPAVQSRVTFCQANVITTEWPSGFDLVILGGNCLYELATPEEQEHVIHSAAACLNPGGYVYVDNDHMEGDLDPSWQQPGVRPGFPTGVCADGIRVESTIETIWFEVPARLAKFRRTTRVHVSGSGETNHLSMSSSGTVSGKVIEVEYIQQKHPVSAVEVQSWLECYGFVIEKTFGDRAGNPYHSQSPRAIFWAQKHPEGNL
jgi:SAM-dependent methyltransferase